MTKSKQAFSLLSDSTLANIAQDTMANRAQKKYDATYFLKLIVFAHLSQHKVSLRTISLAAQSDSFKRLLPAALCTPNRMPKSSVAYLLENLPVEFFQKTFEFLVNKHRKFLLKSNKNGVIKFDSTFISKSSKLLKIGTIAPRQTGKRRQIKATVGYREIPETIDFHFDNNMSDEPSLRQAVLNYHYRKKDIAVFDRGMQNRKSFCELDDKKVRFVTRVSNSPCFKLLQEKLLQVQCKNNLLITRDMKVHLRSKRPYTLKRDFRLIETETLTGGKLYFASNCWDLTPTEICDVYRSRWDIELFFKCLKSHLDGRHFLSHKPSGIMSSLYIKMISAILITVSSRSLTRLGFKLKKQWVFQQIVSSGRRRRPSRPQTRAPPDLINLS